MGLMIGIDEAGYGPNLGPLVIGLTAWKVPGDPREIDLWRAFQPVVTRQKPKRNAAVHIADSKKVYSPGRGLADLERSALATIGLLGRPAARMTALAELLTGGLSSDPPDPWDDKDDKDDLPVPGWVVAEDLSALVDRWRNRCDDHDVRLEAVLCEVVRPRRFNAGVDECGTKGLALSRWTLRLLRRFWNPDSNEPVLVVADKHGGRNFYADLLVEALDGRLPLCRGEGRERSCYQIASAEIRFEARAERHLPVAAASLVAKYVRELMMLRFNRFWARHVPDLRPTAGYPGDAQRFREDIAAAQQRLGIPDAVLWRER